MKFNKLIFITLALGILLVLFFVFNGIKDSLKSEGTSADIQQQIVSSSSANLSNQKAFNVVIKDKKVVGTNVIEVIQGDEVLLKITSDISDEFHLHGYDKSVELEKDETVELKFNADLSGRYPFELEESKIELGALNILPK